MMRGVLGIFVLPVLVGCMGLIGDSDAAGSSSQSASAGNPAPPSHQPTTPGSSAEPRRDLPANGDFFPSMTWTPIPPRLWLLGSRQYDNTVAALVGRPLGLSVAFDREALTDGYRNRAAVGAIDDRKAAQYEKAAEVVAMLVASDPVVYAGCRSVDAACVKNFLATWGKKAWRRPLTLAEVDRYLALFARASPELGNQGGLSVVVESLLRSPYFLYRTETGSPPATAGADVTLTPHELASAIAYTLWDAPPDAELIGLADSGALSNPATLRAQVDRLLGDARAVGVVHAFVSQWLGFSYVAALEKDARAFPRFTSLTAQAIERDALDFVAEVVGNGGGSFRELMTGTRSRLDAGVGWIYGVTNPGAAATQPLVVSLDPKERAGILTRAAFLASHATATETRPTTRGTYLVERVACATVPEPPSNVDTTLPPPNANARTTRERLDEHRTNPVCGSCHRVFDPVGVAFENYDAVGRYRTTENGATIDASDVLALPGLSGRAFQNAVGLVAILADAPVTQACVTRHLFQYLYGRADTDRDDPPLRQGFEALRSSGLDLRRMMAALVTHPAFRTRRPGARP